MSRVNLLPRLSGIGASAIVARQGDGISSRSSAVELIEEHSGFVTFAASGGARSLELAGEIAMLVEETARRHGYPASGDQKTRAAFDRDLAIELGGLEALQTGEALRDDVWAFMTLVLCPDVVAWRFPDAAAMRFEGGPRNAIQRLWMRGSTLDRGPGHEDRWGLVNALSEDAMVQIFERASLSGEPRLARAIAEAWVVTAGRIGRSRMEDVMRRATKLVRLRNEIMDLAFLSDDLLVAEIRSIFERVAGVAEQAPCMSGATDETGSALYAVAEMQAAPSPSPEVAGASAERARRRPWAIWNAR